MLFGQSHTRNDDWNFAVFAQWKPGGKRQATHSENSSKPTREFYWLAFWVIKYYIFFRFCRNIYDILVPQISLHT